MSHFTRRCLVGALLVGALCAAVLLSFSEGSVHGAGSQPTPVPTATPGAPGQPGGAAPAQGTVIAPVPGAAGKALTITKFGYTSLGNTAVDPSGAVIIAGQQVAPPTWLRRSLSPDKLPHRAGAYELVVAAPAPIARYSVQWSADTPVGSQVQMLTGPMDYRSGPGESQPTIQIIGTSAQVTLAKPSQKVWVTFQLFSGIGAAASDPGPSPRLTSVTIVSADGSPLTVTPLTPAPGSNPGTSATVSHSAAPPGGPVIPGASAPGQPAPSP